MSGFELDSDLLVSRFSEAKELPSKLVDGDASQELLARLQRSTDICADLSSLLADRPYVYARVMQQLGSVVGAGRLRRIHAQVVSRAHERSKDAASELKPKVLRKPMDGAASGGQTTSGTADVTEAAEQATKKKFTINLPGASAAEVEIEMKEGSTTLNLSGVNVPYLTNLTGSATINGTTLTSARIQGTLQAKYLKSASVTIQLSPNGSELNPSAQVSADLDLPGMTEAKCSLNIAKDKISGTVSAAKVFGSVGLSGSLNVDVSETTKINGTMKAEYSSGKGFAVDGSVTFALADGALAGGITGDFNVSGVASLTGDSDKINLKLEYDGTNFAANLGSAASFKHQLSEKAEVSYTVNSASYTTQERFSCAGNFEAKLGDHITVSGEAKVANNTLQSANLTMTSTDFKIPQESPILSGSLTGTTGLDEQGFTGANLTGELNIRVGSTTAALALNNLDLSRTGVLSGDVSLAEPLDIKVLKIDTFNSKFDSVTGIKSLDGTGSIKLGSVRSNDGGLKLSYTQGQGVLASGTLQLVKGDESQIAESQFDINVGETLSGSGKFTFTSDVAFPDDASQLKIKAGSSVDVAIQEDVLQDVPFQGKFSYGEGVEAEGALKFSGDFSGKLNMESSTVSLTATAGLDSDYVVNAGAHTMTLLGGGKRSTELNVTVQDSQLTQVTGSVNYKAQIVFKQDKLDLDGKLNNFNYDVTAQKFSGKAETKLQTDFTIDESLKLKNGSKVDVDVVNNDITTVSGNLKAEATVHSQYIEGGKGVFELQAMGAQLDVAAGSFSCPSVSVEIKKGLTLQTLDKKSKLNLTKGSGATGVIENNKLKSFDVVVDYSGSTKIFGDNKEVAIEGNFDMKVTDADTDAKIKGKFDAKLTQDVVLDEIKGLDKFTLLKGTNVELDFDENGAKEIEGDFVVRYNREPNELLTNGIEADLKGKGLKYNIAAKALSGTVKLELNKHLVIGEKKGNNFTAKRNSDITVELKDNEVTKFSGELMFDGDLSMGESKLQLSDGKLALNAVDPNDFGSIEGSVTFNLTGNIKQGNLEVKLEKGAVDGVFEDSELISASLSAGAKIIGSINNNQVTLDVVAELEWLKESGFGGDITVSCKQRTKLGSISGGKYSYGLAAEGEKEAAAFTATISENQFTKLNGAAGFYLEEEGKDTGAGLLKVSGSIAFNYDVLGNNLIEASGNVSIEEKQLSSVGSQGDSLWLGGGSEATIQIANNEITGLSGQVNLELRDGDGKYLEFKSQGELKILETSEINATVSATVVREKELLGGKGELSFWICPGGSSINAVIAQNKVESIDGSLEFKIQRNGKDFFGGSVSGSYKDAKLTAEGTITLLSDFDVPEGKPLFRVVNGTSASANIVNNTVEKIDGNLVVQISAPRSAGFDPAIQVEANGTIDFTSDKPEVSVSGSVSLVKPEVELMEGLSITSLSAQGTITKGEIEEIRGGASIRYKRGSLTIEGAATDFGWVKGKDGAEDEFDFKGHLSVSAFEEKLKGEVDIEYDSRGGAPKVTGEVEFKITDYLKGMIGLKFKEDWTPIVWGTMTCTDVELIAGHKLIGFDKQFGAKIPVYGPISIDAGVGLGASVDLQPVTFNAEINIGEFEVSAEAKMPAFDAEMQLKSGITLNAEVAPYLGVCIDAKIASAGVKLIGSAKAQANADLNMTGKLHGGDDGFWGELGMGLELKASASLSVILQGYASALGHSFKHDFATWDFDLGEIFNVKWGKKFTFGDKEEAADSDESVTPLAAQQSAQSSGSEELKKEYFASKFPLAGPSPKKDKAPNLGNPSQDAKKKADEKGEQAPGGAMEKIEKGAKVASAIGVIAKFIGIVGDCVTAASVAGPIGVVGYLAFKFVTGELSFEQIKADIKALVDGVQAIRDLLQGVDLLALILPPKVYELYMAVKDLTFEQILDKAVEAIEKAIASLGASWAEVLSPVVDFVKKQRDKLVDIIRTIQKGITVENMIKVLFQVLGIAITGIADFIGMVGKVLDKLGKLIQHCVKTGSIKVGPGYWKHLLPHQNWKFEIPGIISASGKDPIVAGLIKLTLGVKEDPSYK